MKKRRGFNHFLQNQTKRGSILDLKKKGTTNLYLATEYEVMQREVVRFPMVREKSENGKTTFFLSNKLLVDPQSRFLEVVGKKRRKSVIRHILNYLESRSDLDATEIVFRIQVGGEVQKICKGDLLGMKDFGYKKKIKPSTEWVITVVDADDVKKGQQVILPPWGPGNKLMELIRDNMGDLENPKKGMDPYETPYPFTIKYNPKNSGADMYSVTNCIDPDLRDISDDTMKLIKSQELDITPWVEPFGQDVEDQIVKLIQKYTKGTNVEDILDDWKPGEYSDDGYGDTLPAVMSDETEEKEESAEKKTPVNEQPEESEEKVKEVAEEVVEKPSEEEKTEEVPKQEKSPVKEQKTTASKKTTTKKKKATEPKEEASEKEQRKCDTCQEPLSPSDLEDGTCSGCGTDIDDVVPY